MTGAATMPRPTPLANAQWLAGREVGPRRPGLHGQGVASGEPISCKKAWPDIPGRLSGCIKAPILSLSLFLGLALAQSFGAEPPPAGGMEQRLRTAIAQIKAIDNHAHPQAVATAAQPDLDFDQLASPVDDFPLPVRLRPDNPELLQAWRDLFGYAHQDFLPEHLAELKAQRAKVMAEKGLLFPAWVLGKIGTETMLANRVAMGPGLAAPAFRWVAFVDALAMPLDHTALAEATPDRTIYYEDIQRLSQRYLAALGLKALPPTLAGYLKEVVNPTLARLKATGAVGIKFEAAYLRSLAFADVLESRAAEISAAHLAGRPAAAEDTALQDYLYRYLAREAGRLELPVQIHVGPGIGGHLLQQGAHPSQLESLLEDQRCSKTKFILLHGAWPYADEVAALLSKPNVYADFSAQTFLLYPPALCRCLRVWLSFIPEKVLFGTDALPTGPDSGWEVLAWLTAHTGREALTLALLGMVQDHEISEDRALALAHAVLRDNALKVYGYKVTGP